MQINKLYEIYFNFKSSSAIAGHLNNLNFCSDNYLFFFISLSPGMRYVFRQLMLKIRTLTRDTQTKNCII